MTEPRAGTTEARDVRGGAHAPSRSRLREPRLLRNPLPVIAAAITTFLVVLVLLTVRLASTGPLTTSTGGQGGAVVASAPGGHPRTIVRTTASGRTIVTKVAGNGHRTASPLTTRTSGGGRDD